MGTEATAEAILAQLTGSFSGLNRLWLQPGPLSDEQPITLTCNTAHTPHFRHLRYQSNTQGKSMVGELLLGYDPWQACLEAAWVDSFHMSKAMMHLVGQAHGPELWLAGDYYAGPEHPRWGWHVTLNPSPQRLLIEMFNVPPDEAPQLAVQLDLTAAKD